MACDADGEAVDLLDHLLSKQRRYAERRSSSQEVLPAIKMLIGDWYTDELGVLTREITSPRLVSHVAAGEGRRSRSQRHGVIVLAALGGGCSAIVSPSAASARLNGRNVKCLRSGPPSPPSTSPQSPCSPTSAAPGQSKGSGLGSALRRSRRSSSILVVRRRRRPTELLGGQMPASSITLRMTFASAAFG